VNRLNKRIILPTILLTGALAVGALGISNVSAQDINYPTIVERLASKFNLDPNQVQEVFTEVHQERQAEIEAQFAQRIEDMVVDGKITEAQKQLILDKHEEMLAKMDEWKDLARDQRRDKMQAYHEELRTWAETNNIDLPFPLMMKGPGHMGGGFRGDFEMRTDQ
jgi:hypothetical protein